MRRPTRVVLFACLIAVAGFIGLAFWFDRNAVLPQPVVQVHPFKSAPIQAVTATVRAGGTNASNKLTLLAAANISKWPDATAVSVIDDGTACGLDQIKSTIDSGKLPPHIVAAARETIEKVARQLEWSRSEQERALALHVQANVRGEAARDQYKRTLPDCDKDVDCRARALAVRQQAAQPRLAALAQLAAAAVDPASYATAFYQCGSQREPACAAITAEHWTAMDPTNAVPWLHVAHAAAARGDTAARDEAVARASVLPLYDLRYPGTLRLMQTDLVLAQPVPVRLAISQDLLSPTSPDFFSPYLQIAGFCSTQADATPVRVKACGHLAEKLIEQDPSVLGQRVGAGIAQVARWSAERVAALNDEYNAMIHVNVSADIVPTSRTNCQGFEKYEAWMSEAARIGEVAMLRQAIGATGKSIAALAEERQSAQKKRVEQAERDNAKK